MQCLRFPLLLLQAMREQIASLEDQREQQQVAVMNMREQRFNGVMKHQLNSVVGERERKWKRVVGVNSPNPLHHHHHHTRAHTHTHTHTHTHRHTHTHTHSCRGALRGCAHRH